LAKAVNCQHGPSAEPDDTCEICRSITSGSCVDVIEMDAASESGVDEIRSQIVEAAEYLPMICRYKVYIIDEVHDLSAKAFDALLKTIEEPPSHVVFILATTEYNKVPPTIRSRCQKFEFHRAGMQDLIGRLAYVAEAESVAAEPAALAAIARMADGGYRDGLTLLEQAILTADGAITLQQVYDQLGLVSEEVVDALFLAIKERDVPKIMDLLSQVARLGRDPRAILDSMMYRLSDLTRASYQVSLEAGTEATREAALFETASRIGRDTILKLRGELAEAHKAIRDISLPRLWLEAELVRLSQIPESSPAKGHVPHDHASSKLPAPAPAQKPKAPAAAPTSAPAAEASAPRVDQPVPATPPKDRAAPADPWEKTVAELNALSKTLGMKLAGATASKTGNKVVIVFDLELKYEWVNERPKVKAAIFEAVQRNFGENVSVEHSVRRRESSQEEPSAVELPAEGSKLEQLARQVFGADPINHSNERTPEEGETDNDSPSGS
jgi:DNA polymerase-3 subunit gamma/tau